MPCVSRSQPSGPNRTSRLSALPSPFGVLKMPDVRNAPGDRASFIRINPDGNVQAVREGRDLVGAAICVRIFEHFDRVAPWFVERRGKRVFARLGDPQASALIERHVHGLGNLRLGGEELDFKSRRQSECLEFRLSGERLVGRTYSVKGSAPRVPAAATANAAATHKDPQRLMVNIRMLSSENIRSEKVNVASG